MSPRSARSGTARAPARAKADMPPSLTGPAADAARFLERIGAAGRDALDGLVHDAELARDEAMTAASPGELGTLQVAWASEQWARAAGTWNTLLCALFDAQAAWWRGADGWMRASLQPWVAASGYPLAIGPLLDAPADPPRGGTG